MTPSTLVSISQGNPATFTKVNNGLGDVKLTIGSAGCGSYEYNTFEVIGTYQLTVGTPAATGITGFSPTIGVSPGEVLDLEAVEDYQPTYNWNINGGTIIGNTTTKRITVVVDNPCNGSIENGYFNASVSYTNSCGTGSSYGANAYIVCGTGGPMFTMSRNPTSDNLVVDDGQKKEVFSKKNLISIFPNPVNNLLNIFINSKITGTATIKIYNSTGKEIKKMIVSSQMSSHDMSALSKGIYFVQILNGDKIKTYKIVKN
jgi:hypothetical protein